MGSFDRKTTGTMKRILNGVGIVLGTLLLMVIGLFLSRVIWLQFNHHYKPMPQGWYHGMMRFIIEASGSIDSSEMPSFFVVAESLSATNWYWRNPTNFSYSSIDLHLGYSSSNSVVRLTLPIVVSHK